MLVNGGWQDEYPAVEVYAVDRSVPDAVAAGDLPVVVGGPEDLLDLRTSESSETNPRSLPSIERTRTPRRAGSS